MSDAVNATGKTGGNSEDDRLVAELRALVARVDPVPAEALVAARSAIAWRSMDVELAHLIEESSAAYLVGTRSHDLRTMLTFESSNLVVEVEVRQVGGGRSLLGQLVPGQPAEVQVRHRDGTISVAADEAGRFAAGPVTAGPMSLRCTAGDVVLETDWFLA